VYHLPVQVRCLSCGYTSRMCEPFMDLSLEFPDRYHAHGTAVHSCRDSCALEGMITHARTHNRLTALGPGLPG